MSIWKYVGGVGGGVLGFFAGGPAGAAAGAALGYGIGQSADAANAQDDASHNTFNATYQPINPNAGIGQGSFGLTDRERYEQQQRLGAMSLDQAQGMVTNLSASREKFVNDYIAAHPEEPNPVRARALAMMTPEYKGLSTTIDKFQGMIGNPDLSDPGRFAAMAEGAQGRQGQTMTRYGVDKTANPDMVNMNRTAGPEIYQMQRQGVPTQIDMQRFNAEQFGIDPMAGADEQRHQEEVRNKNIEVMNSVQDRAMGRGGPSPAELQMKQGQDRAISGQAALAASGGQMDYAQARRQAMLGAADIQQKTASDTGVLRAKEQIEAQNTFGGLSSAQQSADLSARGQTLNQANQRAQFLSGQALENARLQAQQEQASVSSRVGQGQFGAQFGLSQEAQIAQSMAQQRQFGAQFGLSQEEKLAAQRIQQGQFNATFGSQQDQWAAQFQAQQEMNQAGLTQQQRAQNDQYQAMLFNNYMGSRGMEQRNAFQNQNAQLQAQGLNAGISMNNQNAQMQAAGAQMQQGTAIMGMGATIGAAGLANGSFNSPFSSGSGGGGQTYQGKDMFGNTLNYNQQGMVTANPYGTYVPPPGK